MTNELYKSDFFNIPSYQYIIGVDTYDKNMLAYCLMRKNMETKLSEVVLAKTIRDEKAFKEEVKNLAKYFNAKIIEDK